jgi:hypothetical protein
LGNVPARTPIRVTIRWRDDAGLHDRTEQLTPGWHTEVLN